MRELRRDLEDSKSEVKQLTEELRRLRVKESTIDAENQILKSKLLQVDPLGKKEVKKVQYNIPKLNAPQKNTVQQPKLTSPAVNNYEAENNYYGQNSYDEPYYNNGNYDYSTNYY